MKIKFLFLLVLTTLSAGAQSTSENPSEVPSSDQTATNMAASLTPGQIQALAEYKSTSSTPHERVWQNVTVDERGMTTNSYNELATGLNCFNPVTGQYEPAKELFEIGKDGYASATNGQHQVILAPDIATDGVVDLTTPSGQRLLTSPRYLNLSDSSGKSVLIGEVTNSIGQLVTSNVVLYSNAFDALKGSIRYTYTRAGFEQDVILEENIDPSAYGLDPETAQLEMWSEFLSPVMPQTGVKPEWRLDKA